MATQRTVTIPVTSEDLHLLRRDVQGALDSFRQRGARTADQSTEWQQARQLWRLYERLALAFKLAGRR